MVFNFALNISSTIQTFFTALDYITIEPNQAVETTMIRGDIRGILQPVDSFLDILDKHKIKRFHIQRTFALGDILMLVPVVRALRKQGYDPYVRTVGWIQPILELLGIEVCVVGPKNSPPAGEYGIILDGTLEQDHFRPELSELHRVDIYFKAIGVKKVPEGLDWSMNLEKLPKLNLGNDYVVFQSRGSTNKKQLPISTRDYIVRAFKSTNVPIVQIGDGKKLSLVHLFSTIAGAKCLVCVDSGPLWISHFTRTPVIVLFGPTRVEERLIRHPLYPKFVVGIALNKIIGCDSCFERAEKCSGRMDCLKVGPEKVFDLICSEMEHVVKD